MTSSGPLGPSYHIAILTGGGLGPLAKTMTMVNPGPMGFRHKKMLANHWVIMERHKMTRLFGIPTVLGAVVDLPPDDMDFSRLRFSTAVGAPMPVEVGRKLERLTGRKMGQAYGLTETASGIVYPPKDGEIRLGSSGLRRPYSEIKAVILDDAGGYVRDAGTDEIGVLFARGPSVISGYLDPKFDDGQFLEGGWFNTGDLGRIDGDHYVWVTGRAKDVIIRGGHNINPGLIEEPLYEHPAVEIAGAVGKPDAYAGELPVAYVQLRPGTEVTESELKEFVRARISERGANPADSYFLERIPLTGVGKVLRRELRLDAAQRAFRALLAPLADEGIDLSVEVADHATHGTLAKVIVSAGSDAVIQRIHEILEPFVIPHEIICG